MRIAEMFRSIQGEGRLTGVESLFVRASGCNLRCAFCDTPYASWTPEGERLSVAEILGQLASLEASPRSPAVQAILAALRAQDRGASNAETPSDRAAADSAARVRHVVVTGGEPMLFAELVDLCDALRRQSRHITIETAGTVFLPVACDLMSISPKLSNSTPSAARAGAWSQRHEASRINADVIHRLAREYDCQYKFVVAALDDCREVERYLQEFPVIERHRVLLMPLAANREQLAAVAAWLEPYCREHSLAYCPRRQIDWFGTRRGV